MNQVLTTILLVIIVSHRESVILSIELGKDFLRIRASFIRKISL